MTTPASFNTPDRIIRFAMKDAGLLQEGDDPSSEQYAEYLNRFNDVVNFLQTKGIKLWAHVDTTVALTSGTGTYTLTPGGSVSMTKPLRVIQAYYVDSSGSSRTLTALSWQDYVSLGRKTDTGQINSYFVDKQVGTLSVTFWQVPDDTAATGSVHLVLQTQLTNVTSLTEALNFPQEWFIALHWLLAAEICTGQPPSIVQRCEQKAQYYMTVLEDWDVEDADVRFAPSGDR